MNKYVINTKDYNAVIHRDRPIPNDPPLEDCPSTFYEFAAPRHVHIAGFDPNFHGPEDFICRMREACEKL